MTTILLVPAPEHRAALLDGDACGGKVPTLTWCWLEMTDGRDLWCRPSQGARPHEPRVDALVLAHRGVPLPIGCDRAARVLAAREGVDTSCGIEFYEDESGQDHPCFWLSARQEGINYCAIPYDPGQICQHNHVPELASALAYVDGLRRRILALATVCAARGLGRVVEVPGE